jgi:hypothetical protein
VAALASFTLERVPKCTKVTQIGPIARVKKQSRITMPILVTEISILRRKHYNINEYGIDGIMIGPAIGYGF